MLIRWISGLLLQADQRSSSQQAPVPSPDPLLRQNTAPPLPGFSQALSPHSPSLNIHEPHLRLGCARPLPRDTVSQWGDAARWLVFGGDMIQHGKCQSGSDGETTCDPATVCFTSRVTTNQVTVWATRPEGFCSQRRWDLLVLRDTGDLSTSDGPPNTGVVPECSVAVVQVGLNWGNWTSVLEDLLRISKE